MFSFIASLAPTAKMLPSPDTDTEDPKRERYILLSRESDMTYGDDNSSRKDDDNAVVSLVELEAVALIAIVSSVVRVSFDDSTVSFKAMVKWAPGAFIETVPFSDIDVGDGFTVGAAVEFGPTVELGISVELND